ncbi:ATP-dependent helicase HrpB [Mesobacterium pallidum]|uniref:ATP-dependent helicase HrpB n=1 Tax=Mesobacterium pallidum TaxID=2872037 RepID=UPI001EE2610F|nr:ATP-dependent helicase HrpB [Mesobacterium pallidum]
MRLPIDDALPELIAVLKDGTRAVLQAPPGAGKTTRVPLALMEIVTGRIVMLEPRRLAARAAAERLAESLGEPVGQSVGYRIRGESKPGTRIEVVTEGILTRMLQTDPELPGVGCVIFDEFHERSLNADLGLALCLEVTEALRDDLKLLAMSATLDAGPVAELMSAPIVTSEGRAFPVDIRHSDTPLGKRRLEEATADLVAQAVSETTGGVLVFLPGEGEIRRVEALLKPRLPADCHLRPLFGAMDFAAQRAAIRPATEGRKVVLATSIAETSLTIEDIRVVVDAGRARRARFDPSSGMARLVTERVTKAEATQRTGRAGRVAEGTCYRLWTRGEEGALAPFPPAEIETADLAGLALELAQWGATPEALPFLTPPNPGAYAEAQALLTMLGALDHTQRITPRGKRLARLPLHPRLAAMLDSAGRAAAPLAALLADRDPLPRGAPVDLSLRLEALRDPRRFADTRPWQPNRGAIERIKAEAKRLGRMADDKPALDPAEMAALAYPDRIGQRRKGDHPRHVLSGGKGAVLPEGDPLVNAGFLVATDLDGDPREARIRQAAQITLGEIRALFPDEIQWVDSCTWSKRERRVVSRQQERLGAIVLDDRIWKDVPRDAVARAMLDGVRDLGLRLTDAAERFRARVALVRDTRPDLPDMSDAALLDRLEDWLLPYLAGVKTDAQWKTFDPLPALRAMLDWDQMQALDAAAPAHFTTPLGRKIPIDYSGEHPEITLRLQEMFGQTTHPTVGRTPLRVTLLSPGQKPVQTTLDIPGFWASSYADVRKDMRGRYPRHPWPEDPTQADPTLRAKPRG